MQVLRAAKCWQTSLFSKILFLNLFDTSVLAPGPLRTPFELKTALPKAKNQPDATALMENAINLLNIPKNIKIPFRNLPNCQKNKKWQIWGAYNFIYKYIRQYLHAMAIIGHIVHSTPVLRNRREKPSLERTQRHCATLRFKRFELEWVDFGLFR